MAQCPKAFDAADLRRFVQIKGKYENLCDDFAFPGSVFLVAFSGRVSSVILARQCLKAGNRKISRIIKSNRFEGLMMEVIGQFREAIGEKSVLAGADAAPYGKDWMGSYVAKPG